MKILAAKVLKAHGLHGVVKIVSYLNNWLEKLSHIENKNHEKVPIIKSTIFHQKNNYFLIKLENINNLEDAMNLIGDQWFIDTEHLPSLPMDNFYYYQLMNLPIYDSKNNLIGKVDDVSKVGGGDVILVHLNIDTMVYLPFDELTFPEIYSDKIIISDHGIDILFN